MCVLAPWTTGDFESDPPAEIQPRDNDRPARQDPKRRFAEEITPYQEEPAAFRGGDAATRREAEELVQLRFEVLKVRKTETLLRTEALKLNAEIHNLTDRAARREKDLESSINTLQDVQKELDRANNELGVLRAQQSEIREELSSIQDRNIRIESDGAATASALSKQRDRYRQQVEAIENSVSWRLAAPVRWLGLPFAQLRAILLKAIFETPSYRYTGKPLAKFLSAVKVPGTGWLLPCNPLFDDAFYRSSYPEAAKSSKNLWAHYLAYGCDELRDPNPLFKTSYYQLHYPDVAAAGVNPLVHYLQSGAKEGRDPNPDFDTSYYLENSPDVSESGMNALLHFELHGQAEGRPARRHAGDQGQFAQPLGTNGTTSHEPTESPKPTEPEAVLSVSVDEPAESPFFSVLIPTFNTPPRCLRAAIDSVLAQSFDRWECCIYDDGSTSPETLRVLEEYIGRDPRIEVKFGKSNAGIAAATNQAMNFAKGQYIAMLDHDDEVLPNALEEVANVLKDDPSIDALYTDSACIDAEGGNPEPFFKPDWSLEFFRGVMFVGHLLVVRHSLAADLGGFDSNFDRVQDFEFMLRVSEKRTKIHHLPKVLYYWRRIPGSVAFHGNEKGPIEPIQASAVNAHLRRMGIPAVAEPHPTHAHRQTINPLHKDQSPRVAIFVRECTLGQAERCMRSIRDHSSYSNFRLLRSSATGEIGDYGLGPRGAKHPDATSAEYLIWVNSDLELLTPGWIEHLLLYCEQSQFACAAPLLTNTDDSVWNAGLVLGMNGVVGYPMRGWRSDSDGYAGSLSCAREVSCISGECLMVSRQMLERLGSWVKYYEDPVYAGADLSLRGYTLGLRSIVTPRAVLRKLTQARQIEDRGLDFGLFADRWSPLAKHGDPFYNPNFNSTTPGYETQRRAVAAG